MALNIRNREAERLAAELAECTGETKTDAVIRALRNLDLFISTASIELHPVDAEQAYRARRAYSRFGKGRHKSGLSYGDCFSYALAILVDEPLLFKGDDFVHTDLRIANPLDTQGRKDIHDSPTNPYT